MIPVSFTVSSSPGHDLFWTVCQECGELGRADSEDGAVQIGLAHTDERHPDQELDVDATRTPSSVLVTVSRGRVLARCVLCEVVLHDGPARESRKARSAAYAHVSENHPFQVWSGPEEEQ